MNDDTGTGMCTYAANLYCLVHTFGGILPVISRLIT